MTASPAPGGPDPRCHHRSAGRSIGTAEEKPVRAGGPVVFHHFRPEGAAWLRSAAAVLKEARLVQPAPRPSHHPVDAQCRLGVGPPGEAQPPSSGAGRAAAGPTPGPLPPTPAQRRLHPGLPGPELARDARPQQDRHRRPPPRPTLLGHPPAARSRPPRLARRAGPSSTLTSPPQSILILIQHLFSF